VLWYSPKQFIAAPHNAAVEHTVQVSHNNAEVVPCGFLRHTDYSERSIQ